MTRAAVHLIGIILIMISTARSGRINKTHGMISPRIVHGEFQPLALDSFSYRAAVFLRHPLGSASQHSAEPLVFSYQVHQLNCGISISPDKLQSTGILLRNYSEVIQIECIAGAGTTAYSVESISVAQLVEIYCRGHINIQSHHCAPGQQGFIFRPFDFIIQMLAFFDLENFATAYWAAITGGAVSLIFSQLLRAAYFRRFR